MCGISGYIGQGVERATLERMSAALTHRGPDESGQYLGDGFGLAHRRLSIIDLVSGQQPMRSADGYVLSYNGEIYNFRELRRELDLAFESILAHLGSHLGRQHLDHNLAAQRDFFRNEHSAHAATAEFLFDTVGVADCGLELLQEVRHGR